MASDPQRRTGQMDHGSRWCKDRQRGHHRTCGSV